MHSEDTGTGWWGVWIEGRGFIPSHRSSFTFRKPYGLLSFSISPFSFPPAPWGGLLSPPIFIKVSPQLQPGPPSFPIATSSPPPSIESSTSVMGLFRTWVHCDVRWAECMFTCCLARLWELCGGVWRQNGREISVWKETEAPCFPPTHTPHILTKESHSLGQMVPDTFEDCPSCTLFIPPCRSFLFSLCVSLPSICHLASVFGGGIA